MAFWYSFWYFGIFLRVGMFVPRKIWQPCWWCVFLSNSLVCRTRRVLKGLQLQSLFSWPLNTRTSLFGLYFFTTHMYTCQGDQMSLWKDRPTCSPNHFTQKLLHNLNHGKSGPQIWATYVTFNQLSKVNHPMGENSPHLVTLTHAANNFTIW
jgi:hypothetical protein